MIVPNIPSRNIKLKHYSNTAVLVKLTNGDGVPVIVYILQMIHHGVATITQNTVCLLRLIEQDLGADEYVFICYLLHLLPLSLLLDGWTIYA